MNISSQWPKTDSRWYLGVRCQKCQMPILFGLDRNEGMEQTTPLFAAKLVLTCTLDNCKHQADYTAAAVSRFQKQAATQSAAARNTNESSTKRREQKRRT